MANIVVKPIDIKTAEVNKLTLDELIGDAVARKDKKALQWLKEQANEMKTRKKEDGSTYQVRKSIVEIRPAYLRDFLKYQSKSEAAKQRAKDAKKAKAQQKIDDAFAAAFAELGE